MLRRYYIAYPILLIHTDASTNNSKKINWKKCDDGTVKNLGPGKKDVGGSVLLTDNIYGSAIPEGFKENIFQILGD